MIFSITISDPVGHRFHTLVLWPEGVSLEFVLASWLKELEVHLDGPLNSNTQDFLRQGIRQKLNAFCPAPGIEAPSISIRLKLPLLPVQKKAEA